MPEQHVELHKAIVEALKQVYDPEIPVDIYELGLIYGIDIDKAGNVQVVMTLTTPNCPAADTIIQQVEQSIKAVKGVGAVTVTLTFDPPYDTSRMSEAAKLELGLL